MYRNYKLNELRIENVGEEVVLSGWISKIRDKGHFVFIDLRDRYGVTQIFVNEEVSGKEMLEKVNALGIGPQGYGGKTTALRVLIETYPTHIAGLPICVNINCHATRHKEVTL